MGDFNSRYNRAVWFDIPVTNLDRAISFYRAVLAVGVEREAFEDSEIGVIEHRDGNGGCLVPDHEEITGAGVLVYLNVDGRIRAAVAAVVPHGGSVLHDTHSIGPHGYRAVILDSEGNRVALHSNSDA